MSSGAGGVFTQVERESSAPMMRIAVRGYRTDRGWGPERALSLCPPDRHAQSARIIARPPL